jgi:alanine dehydrogenase
VIIGGGVSGTHAAEMAVGLRADVTVIDRSDASACASSTCSSAPSLKTLYSTTDAIERSSRMPTS